MIVLTTTSSPQTVTVIPRYEPTGTVRVTIISEEQNKRVRQFNTSYTYTNGVLSFNIPASSSGFVEDTFYSMKVEEQDGANYNMLHRAKIFVTDQTTLPKYTTQENEFTEYQDNNNEFVII